MISPLYLALVAMVLDLLGSANYIRDVCAKRTKPHVFSWFIWGLLMGLGAIVSVSQGAWQAALSLALGAAINFAVCILGVRMGGTRYVRPLDWVALFAAMTVIPVWLSTHNALWAAVIVTGINISGCFPSLRKAWHFPGEENLWSFSVFGVAALLRLCAVTPFNVTTALYPATIMVMDFVLITVICLRRSQRTTGGSHAV